MGIRFDRHSFGSYALCKSGTALARTPVCTCSDQRVERLRSIVGSVGSGTSIVRPEGARVKRPTNIAIIAAVMSAGAVALALAGMAFFAVALLIASGSGSAEPVSVAIIGMGLSGGFALLILACLVACLAMNVVEFRDWARGAFSPAGLDALGQTARHELSSASRSWAAAFPSRNKNHKLSFRPSKRSLPLGES